MKITNIEKGALLHNALGLRFDNNQYKIGDCLPCSHDWDYENDAASQDLLNGTCAISLNNCDNLDELEEKINEAEGKYIEPYIYIIASDDYEYGADDGEIIIAGAKVVGVVK